MRIITRRVHGVLDYLVGVLLILAPTLFDFRIGGAAQWLPVTLGVATIIYSLLTRYELGAIRLLSFRTHLALDAVNGVLLALSPWIFGFSDQVFIPHLLLGLIELGAVMMTRADVSDGPRARQARAAR